MTEKAPAAGTLMGCAIQGEEKLTADGWEWRCNTDTNRLREVVDTFEEMGFEVRLEPLNLERLSESCAGCMETLCRLSAVYIRRPSRAG